MDTNTPTPTTADNNNQQTTPGNPLLRASNPLVSDLEQEVLDEYARLLGNVNKVFPQFYFYQSTKPFHMLITHWKNSYQTKSPTSPARPRA